MQSVEEQIDAVIPLGCRMLNTQQLAKVTGLANQLLRRWRSDKSAGPSFVKLGPKIVGYPRDAVIDWMKANAVQIGR